MEYRMVLASSMELTGSSALWSWLAWWKYTFTFGMLMGSIWHLSWRGVFFKRDANSAFWFDIFFVPLFGIQIWLWRRRRFTSMRGVHFMIFLFLLLWLFEFFDSIFQELQVFIESLYQSFNMWEIQRHRRICTECSSQRDKVERDRVIESNQLRL